MKFSNFMIPLSMMALLLVNCKGEHTNNQDDGNNDPPTVVEAPDMIIPVEKGAELFANYRENRISLIEETENADLPEGQDPYLATTSVTFDFEELKQYMKYIDKEAKKSKTRIKGLRVYLGQYSDTKNEKHPRAETVFFNPTMVYKDNQEVSFAIQHQNGNSMAVPVGQILDYGKKPAGRTNLTLTVQDSITSLAGNHGGRRPPPATDEGDY
ncbi:hypothetical protein ACFO3O_12360 [Dokdonia ponticola]|uniref:DUF4840 domain-containing protein n=1 Tax=Dokdonia ponticola TaxID=2041041 RepID=A0ABV9HY03_9FLAO